MWVVRRRWWVAAAVMTVLAVAAVSAAHPSVGATVTGQPTKTTGTTLHFFGGSATDIDLDLATGWFHAPNMAVPGVRIHDGVGNVVGSYGASVGNTIVHLVVGTDRVYATTIDNRVEYFDRVAGTHLGSWGSAGSANGQFQTPWGIDVSATEVFVADAGNDRVQVFDFGGDFKRSIDGLGTLRPMAEVSAIVVDEGLLYVGESSSDEIVIYDAQTGDLVDSFPAGFTFIEDLEITTANDLFVTGDNGPDAEAAVFTVSGIEQTRFPLTHPNPAGFAVDPSGESLWVTGNGFAFGEDHLPGMATYTWARCDGQTPTFVGTSVSDSIDLSSYSSGVAIWLGDGADDISAGTGDDIICGGGGPDTIRGNAGNDVIYGGPGADDLRGGPGSDSLLGEEGGDALSGGGGADTLFGGDGPDELFGGAGPDTISGGGAGDVIHGQGAADVLVGDAGNDELNGQNGADEMRGGDGGDILRGHTGPDDMFGGDADDDVRGGNGADTLRGGAGFDKCAGNLGPDSAEAATCEQTPGVETLF